MLIIALANLGGWMFYSVCPILLWFSCSFRKRSGQIILWRRLPVDPGSATGLHWRFRCWHCWCYDTSVKQQCGSITFKGKNPVVCLSRQIIVRLSPPKCNKDGRVVLKQSRSFLLMADQFIVIIIIYSLWEGPVSSLWKRFTEKLWLSSCVKYIWASAYSSPQQQSSRFSCYYQVMVKYVAKWVADFWCRLVMM